MENNIDLNEAQENQDVEKEVKWGVRHLQAVILFILITALTSISTCLNIAVIAMSQKSNHTHIQIFDWNKDVHGYIISSTSWCGFAIQLYAGVLINRYGGKFLITCSVALTSLLMIITPWSAYVGDWIGVCVVMALQGFCQGFMYPGVQAMLGRWAPVNERTRLGMFIYSGMYLGLIVTPPITTWIGSTSYGWPWIFYFFGFQTLASCVLWMVYGSDSPYTCKRISVEERELIEKSLQNGDPKLSANIPWRKIFTSVPFYALICAQIGGSWGFMTIYNETPSYLILGLDLNLMNTGWISSLTYVNGLFFTLLASWISDFLHNRNYLSMTNVRKLSNTVGTWSPALFFIVLVFLPREKETLIIVALIMVAGLDGISSCGYMINHIDLSPRYAAVLVGIASTISDGICMLQPIVSGQIVGEDSHNLDKWKYVFVIGSCMYFFGNISFLLFGSGEKQPWNDIITTTNDDPSGVLSIELLEKNEGDIKSD